jgi:hypothetical protein
MTAPRKTKAGTQARDKSPGAPKPPAQNDRDARLKAALKANIARRKEQARARAGDAPVPPQKD